MVQQTRIYSSSLHLSAQRSKLTTPNNPSYPPGTTMLPGPPVQSPTPAYVRAQNQIPLLGYPLAGLGSGWVAVLFTIVL